MNYEFRLDESYSSDWNKTLLKSEFGNIFNSVEYSEYVKIRLGWKPRFLSIIDSQGKLVGQCILFEYVSRRFGKNLNRIVSQFPLNTTKKLKWNYGPIIFAEEKDLIFKQFLEFLVKTKRNLDGTTHPLLPVKFDDINLKISRWSTFLIDLKKPINSLFENMEKKSVRKNIKRSEERGVTVHEINEHTIKEYHDILNESRADTNNQTFDYEDTKKLWDLLKPIGFTGFISKKEDIITGGITFSFFNKYINEWGVARTRKDTNEKLYSQDLLKWKIIEWGKNHNDSFYDLSGVNPEPKTEKENGILRYKKKWGGTMKDYLIIRR